MRILWGIPIFFLSMAYIYPLRIAPWTTFHRDMSFWLFLGMVALTVEAKKFGFYDKLERRFAILLVILTVGPLLFQEETYTQDARIQRVIYAWVAFFGLLVGRRISKNRYFPSVAAAIVFSAIFLTLVSLVQWHGWFSVHEGWVGFLASDQVGARVSSAIGQANNYATFLIISMWLGFWLLLRRITSFRAVWWVASLVILSQGLVLSQSRTGVLSLTLSTIFITVWSKWHEPRKLLKHGHLCPILVWAVATAVYVYVFDLNQRASSVEGMAAGDPQRLRMWSMAIESIIEKPITGWGVGSIPSVALAYSSQYGSFDHSILTHFHNVILDVLVEYGLLMGFFIFYLISSLMAAVVRAALGSAENAILLCSLVPLLVHAMLEFPLSYGYFLWFGAFLSGVILGPSDSGIGTVISERVHKLIVLVFISSGIWMWVAYLEVEDIYTKVRGGYSVSGDDIRSSPSLVSQKLFSGLLERIYWVVVEVGPDKPLTEAERVSLENVTLSYPTYLLMWKTAVSYGALGDENSASWWAQRLCSMYSEEQCRAAASLWNSHQESAWPTLPWDNWLKR